MYCYNSEIKFNLFKFIYARLLICLSHFNMLVTNSTLPLQIFFKLYRIVRNGGMRVCMRFFWTIFTFVFYGTLSHENMSLVNSTLLWQIFFKLCMIMEWWSEGLYVFWQFSLLSLWDFNNSLLNMSLANSSLLWLIFLKLYKTIRNCVLGFCILFDNVYLCCFRDLSQNFSIPWKMVCCIATSTLPWSIFIELYKIIRNGFLRVYINL